VCFGTEVPKDVPDQMVLIRCFASGRVTLLGANSAGAKVGEGALPAQLAGDPRERTLTLDALGRPHASSFVTMSPAMCGDSGRLDTVSIYS
jgi:hypothetical protein